MSARKPRAAKPVKSMEMTIEAQRQQLFRASAVIDVCRYACDSEFADFDLGQLADALHVAYELIDDVGGVLEQYAGAEATRRGGGL